MYTSLLSFVLGAHVQVETLLRQMHFRLSLPPQDGVWQVLLYPNEGGTQQSQHRLHPLGQFSRQQFPAVFEPQQFALTSLQ